MIIYKCIITGDEMFSDIYKIKESPNGILYEVQGKTICRKDDIDDSLIGANASTEEQGESCEGVSVSGVDIVLNHKLQETSFKKEVYKAYIKDYMKAIKTKLAETNPDRVQPFVAGAQEEIKKIMGNFKNFQFFTGESMNPDGMVGLLDYRSEDDVPIMLFFKDGLEAEKC